MKAIIVKQPGGPEELSIAERTKPSIKPDELLIQVKAVSINRADIEKRKGNYPGNSLNEQLLGLEISGIVEKVGKDVADWKQGDKVFGLLNNGGYAEFAAIQAARAMKIPDGWTFEQAAAVPEVFLTAYQTLHWIGALKQNEWVLIHAGASGVGTAAIQLAKLADAQVIVTAGSDEKLAFCRELGADYTINYKTQNFDEEVADITRGEGVQLILDFIGASYWKQNISSLSLDGRMVLIGFLGGSLIEQVDLMPLFSKRVEINATLLGTRSNDYKARLTQEFADKYLPLLENGTIKPIIDKVFPFEKIAEAHKHMEASKNIGKIVVKID
ncbi:NAD(P)H-quinone oxidoreductase [Bacillus sp. 1P06AnD]|uniref:NAD(P)H-quinone oxidoreductase n=1 Tax=Bacillus sp. 1P06AnD TaxID=3132208 RepID=UPI00399F6415